MGKYIDITGQKFGKLTAVKFIEKRNKYIPYWLFICDCGNTTIANKHNVTHGRSRSCGCIEKERPNATKHGFVGTNFYIKWTSISSRIKYSPQPNYKGIACLWKSFDEFRDDMYESYLEHCKKFGERNTTLDRIDCRGDYSKENCRWASRKLQGRNKTNNKLLRWGEDTRPMSEWAEIIGINYMTLKTRIRRGWDDKKALSTPTR